MKGFDALFCRKLSDCECLFTLNLYELEFLRHRKSQDIKVLGGHKGLRKHMEITGGFQPQTFCAKLLFCLVNPKG